MTKNYKIVHDRDVCIGCSACASVCPKYWTMNTDGKSDIVDAINTGNGEEELLDNLTEDFEDNMDAAESCPVNCIHIHDIDKDEKLI